MPLQTVDGVLLSVTEKDGMHIACLVRLGGRATPTTHYVFCIGTTVVCRGMEQAKALAVRRWKEHIARKESGGQ